MSHIVSLFQQKYFNLNERTKRLKISCLLLADVHKSLQLSPVYAVQTNPGSTPGLKLARVNFCRVNTANPGSTRVSLEKCRINTTWVSFNPG